MADAEHPRSPDDALPLAELESATDADLILLVRAGDSVAYEHLFLRHREVAIRYARRISDNERAEDLCAEAFTKILDLLQRGKGPDIAFRAYLLTTVRTSHLNAIRSGSREDLVPDHEPIARMLPHTDDPDARYDAGAICRAFNKLPKRWQTALWLTSVEGLSHEEASKHLGVKVNAVASLTFRARAGLRQAYLSEHLLETDDPRCRRIIELLPAYLRDGLTPRRKAVVETHLSTCAACTTAALELAEVNGRLGALLTPIALIGFTAGAAAIVPAKATTLAAFSLTAVSGAGSAATAALKSVGVSTVLQAKAGGAALSGMVGSKVAVAATVTVVGLAVGAEVNHCGSPGLPVTPPGAETAIAADGVASAAPIAQVRRTTSSRPTSARITPPLPVTEDRSAIALDGRPQPTPSAAPAPAGTPPAEGTRSTSMSIGQPSAQRHPRTGLRWDQVTIPVDNPVGNAVLTVTTTRTLSTAPASTTGTGWVCGAPVTNWFDGNFFATSRVSCRYTDTRDAGPLVFDYRVTPGSLLVAALVPPPTYLDTDLSDNQRELRLR